MQIVGMCVFILCLHYIHIADCEEVSRGNMLALCSSLKLKGELLVQVSVQWRWKSCSSPVKLPAAPLEAVNTCFCVMWSSFQYVVFMIIVNFTFLYQPCTLIHFNTAKTELGTIFTQQPSNWFPPVQSGYSL